MGERFAEVEWLSKLAHQYEERFRENPTENWADLLKVFLDTFTCYELTFVPQSRRIIVQSIAYISARCSSCLITLYVLGVQAITTDISWKILALSNLRQQTNGSDFKVM